MTPEKWTVQCINEPSEDALRAYWRMCCLIASRTIVEELENRRRALVSSDVTPVAQIKK